MADLATFIEYTNTRQRRHTFYCYSTLEFFQDQVVFFLLVQAFKAGKRKRQARLINEWFILGNIPESLQAKGYMGIVNINSSLQKRTDTAVTSAINAVGATFGEKVRSRGIIGAIQQKLNGNTGLDETLFNEAENQVVLMLDGMGRFGGNGSAGAGATYQKDGTYQPNGAFASQVPELATALKSNGFDADDLGIY